MEYWEDFNDESIDMNTIEEVASNIGISYKSTITGDIWNNYDISNKAMYQGGVLILGKTGVEARTSAMRYFFGNTDDYLQFELKNSKPQKRMITLSFLFRFTSIAEENGSSNYQLPIKLVALDKDNQETVLKNSIKLPYRCYLTSNMHNKSFHEILTTVEVPANETVRLQVKLDGDLPTICPASGENHAGVSHPVECSLDNVAISGGDKNTISMKSGETYQLNLDTVDTDTVKYFTNSYLAKYTHDNSKRSGRVCTCNYYDTIVADVNESGLITASTVGETALIAEITHQDGTVERKQCIIKVEE